jgi:hypothetical protein
MGFSHGGNAALYSSLVHFRKMHGKPDVQFAAHISQSMVSARRHSTRTRY